MSCSLESTPPLTTNWHRGDKLAESKLLATHQLGVSYKLTLLTQLAVAGAESLAQLKHSARLSKIIPVGWLGWWVTGWVRKAENKAQHSTDNIPRKLIAELHQSARLGKTFLVGGGWLGGEKLGNG